MSRIMLRPLPQGKVCGGTLVKFEGALPPHPGPLPKGEGEFSAVCRRIRRSLEVRWAESCYALCPRERCEGELRIRYELMVVLFSLRPLFPDYGRHFWLLTGSPSGNMRKWQKRPAIFPQVFRH